MRIGISNLAWDPAEDEAIAAILRQLDIDAIDIAPGKYFQLDSVPTASEIARVRQQWQDRGIAITGMQALLFGTRDLNLFGTVQQQSDMLQHLQRVCIVGARLGATRLVFGSPRNRDRNGLDDAQAITIATEFFSRLGDIAAREGVLICLEPNPRIYGANFLIDSVETASLVACIGQPSIRMQLDTGAIAANGEECSRIVRDFGTLIGHIHASEPGLATLGDGSCDHAVMAAAIRQSLPDHIVCIEMLASAKEPHAQAVERAIRMVQRHYGAD